MHSNNESDDRSLWQFPWAFFRFYFEPFKDLINQTCDHLKQPVPNFDGMSVAEILLWLQEQDIKFRGTLMLKLIKSVGLGMEIEQL